MYKTKKYIPERAYFKLVSRIIILKWRSMTGCIYLILTQCAIVQTNENKISPAIQHICTYFSWEHKYNSDKGCHSSENIE